MPGPGRSKGCYRCRSKKIKCDENHPECRRCQNLGIQCPGYRPENELVFCNMNESVEERMQAGPSKRSKPPSSVTKQKPKGKSLVSALASSSHRPSNQRLPTPPDEPQQPSSAIVKRINHAPITNHLSSDFHDIALCRFYADYVIETDDLHFSPGFLDRLPNLNNRLSRRDNVLGQAMSAVSLVHFSNQVNAEDLAVEAQQAYGKGLALLHKALSEGLFTSDQVLAGVVMLNMYEMFSGDNAPRKSVWETHGDALGMLLRVRGTSTQFTSGEAGGMSRAAHRIILFKNLLRRTAPGLESQLWEESVDPNTPWNIVHLACNRIARLLPTADAILHTSPSTGEQSKALLHTIAQFQAEDSKYQYWQTAELSSHTIETTPQLPHSHLPTPPPEFNTATSWLIHRSWNIYRAARLILLQTLLNLCIRTALHSDLSHLSPGFLALRTRISNDISSTIDAIASSTFVVLQELDGNRWRERGSQDGKAIAGYTSIFPLKVALSVKGLGEGQRAVVGGQLGVLERTLGLRQARTIRRAD